MIIDSWTVYWNEYSADTYLYGSKIQFHKKNDIEFENRLMPPGTVIKKWYSKTNFQIHKVEPALPIIDGESQYQIEVDMDCEENESYLFRLVFFDKFGKEAGAVAIWDKVTDFTCPLKTYSYQLELINGGMTHFHFHSVVIREISDDTEADDSTTK